MKFLLTACCFFFLLQLDAQVVDTAVRTNPALDSVVSPVSNIYKNLTDSNSFINVKGVPVSLSVIPRKKSDNREYFYLTAGVLFILALMRTFYSRYFNTLFRVFFNTSLRQNQLTDQLMQAGIPSLIFNIFFVLTSGLYMFLILKYYALRGDISDYKLLSLCFGIISGCYVIKYLSLRFTGWITNLRNEADTYVFVVFLFNKITGILILPFIILISFSTVNAASLAVSVSFIILALILLMRFFRSFDLLRNKLKITLFHFILYVGALEILPLALIYKGVRLFIS